MTYTHGMYQLWHEFLNDLDMIWTLSKSNYSVRFDGSKINPFKSNFPRT